MPCNYSEYPPDWKETRRRILERDGHKCKFCHAPNYAHIYRPLIGQMTWELMPEGHEADMLAEFGVKFTKIILTIAHLDHDHKNHQVTDDRLAALCQRCHLILDMPYHVANRKANAHRKKEIANQTNLF